MPLAAFPRVLRDRLGPSPGCGSDSRRRAVGSGADTPRRAASVRFSAIDMDGAVPLNGFWNTRPISAARRCSGHAVISAPSSLMLPASTGNPPATALSSVDFPEPDGPTTATISPALISKLIFLKTSLRRGAAYQATQRIGGQTGDDEHHNRHHEVGNPQQELLQHRRNGRQI